jgi:hypothetical protein
MPRSSGGSAWNRTKLISRTSGLQPALAPYQPTDPFERMTGIEPAASCLASKVSTMEIHPHSVFRSSHRPESNRQPSAYEAAAPPIVLRGHLQQAPRESNPSASVLETEPCPATRSLEREKPGDLLGPPGLPWGASLLLGTRRYAPIVLGLRRKGHETQDIRADLGLGAAALGRGPFVHPGQH